MQAQQLRVSDNHRFLVHAKTGEPFFWLGDTAWELFHRLNREDATYYLQNRAAKGFTVIQAVAIAEFDGVREPNAYGDLPFRNEDPLQPNEPYWRHVDFIINKANELGLHIGLLPTWGDKWNKAWGLGPVIFNPSNAEAYGEWIGRRYRNTAGIIWILGGDRNVETDEHRAILRAMARGIRRGDNGAAHLMTFHPTGGRGSAEAFHNDDWLDFNMRQNGHTAEFTGRYDKTRIDYDRQPVKPVLDGEPIYEDHPVNFKAGEFGHSISSDVRRPLYWDLFTGAFGHTYGHHSVWQMWTPARHKPINNPLLDWKSALDQPGAAQMQYARWLLESRPFLDRIPDDSVIVPDPALPTHIPGAGRYRFVATRDRARTYAMVYAPVSRKFKVHLDSIAGPTARAWWYDPRTGKSTQIGTFPTSAGEKEFTPPNPGEMQDWILVFDDASKNYPAPGARREQ